MNIGKFSVNNTVLVNILILALLVMGFISLSRLPREMMSDINFSWVLISILHPGVSAEEMEKNVTIKVENELADLDRLKDIQSTTWEGKSIIWVKFEDDISEAEFARLYQEARTEFDKVPLPDGALDPYVKDFSTSEMWPMLTLVLKGEASPSTINKATRDLQERLLDIPDITSATIIGGREREIWVEVNRDKIEALGLPLETVAGAIQYRNQNVPGGILKSGAISFVLQTMGELKKAEDFGNIIVRSRPGGGMVRVRDVATVNSGLADSRYDVRYNGERAIYLWLSKTDKGNSIRLAEKIREVVEDFQQTLPAGLGIQFLGDTSVQIRDTVKVLGINSVLGIVFVVMVLLFFLGFRNALITALGIPFTFAITFIFFEIYGESLNGNSLFGLVLALGMIVDHAIVIMENSYRHRQKGVSRREAAVVGTNEVVKPVVAGTLTTVAAFLPLMILPGVMGKFMRIIPIVVSLTLVASTLEALFFLPVHFADWGSKVQKKERAFVLAIQNGYRRFMAVLYRRRYLTFLSAIIILLVSTLMAPLVKEDLFAGDDFPQFYMDIHLPLGTSREVTDRVSARFERKILPLVGNGEIKGILNSVGFIRGEKEWLTLNSVAGITVELTELTEGRRRPISEIMEEVKEMCKNIPGTEQVVYRKFRHGPPVEKPVMFRIQGTDFEDMAAIADEYKQLLSEYPELYNINDNFDRGNPELRIRIDESRAAELGITAASVGMTIRNSFEGIKATSFYDQDEEIDVIVKFAEAYRRGVEDVKQMKIITPDGRKIPLSAVCRVEQGKSPANIKRVDGKREITVSADTRDKSRVKTINARIQKIFQDKFKISYPEISINMAGELEEFNRLVKDILRLLGVGLFLMYLILGAQFNSFLQPFIMIFTLPFAAVGCVSYLVITDTPLSIVVMFALVGLVGISVNDSIVLVSFINRLRRKGHGITQAVLEGSVVRLRPILLTSITTIGGLLPMAIGLGGHSPVWAPMASTIIFGLFFSTLGTLIIIPCTYGILDDFLHLIGSKMKLHGE